MRLNLNLKNKIFVISLGGSILVPDEINVKIIINLRDLFKKIIKRQRSKFILIVGGGRLARNYQIAAKKINPPVSQIELDKIGIAATRLNAELIKTIFGNLSLKNIIYSERLLKKPAHKITVLSGWNPGCSTDTIAVRAARKLGINTVIIVGRPEYVYSQDFAKFKNAKPFISISWVRYRKLVPSVWSPGMPSPVDPVAAKEAQKNNIDVVIIGGKDLKNIESLLVGKKFKGTIISNSKQNIMDST